MLGKLSTFIARHYSLRLLIALFIAVAFFFWLFNFSPLPLSNPALKKVSNGGELLDMRLYYSAQEAYQEMGRYGTEGRAVYLRFLLADFLFAMTYGLTFSLLLTRLNSSLFSPDSPWTKLNLLPLGIALADCSENICLFLLLISYPGQNMFIGALAGIATLSKWVLTVVTLSVLVVLGLRLLAKRTGFNRA